MPQHGTALPVVALSAKTGAGVGALLPTVLDAHDRWSRRVTTALLNRWLAAVKRHHPHPGTKGGKKLRFKYMTQLKGRPPTFVVWTNRPAAAVLDSYTAFLRRALRDEFDLHGIPIRLLFRSTAQKLNERLEKHKQLPRSESDGRVRLSNLGVGKNSGRGRGTKALNETEHQRESRKVSSFSGDDKYRKDQWRLEQRRLKKKVKSLLRR